MTSPWSRSKLKTCCLILEVDVSGSSMKGSDVIRFGGVDGGLIRPLLLFVPSFMRPIMSWDMCELVRRIFCGLDRGPSMSKASKSRVSGPLLGEYPGKSSMSVSRTSCAVGCALRMRNGAGRRPGDKREEGPDMVNMGSRSRYDR